MDDNVVVSYHSISHFFFKFSRGTASISGGETLHTGTARWGEEIIG